MEGRRCRQCGEPVPGRRWKCDDCKAMTGPRSPSSVVARERQVLDLRAAGHTFDRIAEQLGYADESGAWRAYRRALGRSGQGDMTVGDRRALQVHRIDLALAAIWELVANGDLAAIDRFERLEKLRARLEGTMTAHHAGGGRDGDDESPRPDRRDSNPVVAASRLVQLREKRDREAAERFAP